MRGQDASDRRHDRARAEHADLDAGRRHVPNEREILGAYRPGGEGDDLPDLGGVLDGQGGEDRCPMEAEGPEDADVQEGSGASGGVEAGDGEQDSFSRLSPPRDCRVDGVPLSTGRNNAMPGRGSEKGFSGWVGICHLKLMAIITK